MPLMQLQFEEIHYAYSVLIDAQKREIYNRRDGAVGARRSRCAGLEQRGWRSSSP